MGLRRWATIHGIHAIAAQRAESRRPTKRSSGKPELEAPENMSFPWKESSFQTTMNKNRSFLQKPTFLHTFFIWEMIINYLFQCIIMTALKMKYLVLYIASMIQESFYQARAFWDTFSSISLSLKFLYQCYHYKYIKKNLSRHVTTNKLRSNTSMSFRPILILRLIILSEYSSFVYFPLWFFFIILRWSLFIHFTSYTFLIYFMQPTSYKNSCYAVPHHFSLKTSFIPWLKYIKLTDLFLMQFCSFLGFRKSPDNNEIF